MILGEKARDTPYEVEITLPVEGYEPIQFTLTKMCGKLLNHIAWTELNFLAIWFQMGLLCFEDQTK